MSDPIKAALEAAWRAWMTDPDDTTPEHQAWARRISAEAVAAFLRALPLHRMQKRILTRPALYETDATSTVKLAAAVERAAREGGG